MSSEIKDNRYIKEKRRSRVRSLRSALSGFLILWIIVSVGMIVFLTLRILSLQEQIDKISGTNVSFNDTKAPVYTEESNLAGLNDSLKVYLTFDDGPSENTPEILKILDDYGVKATFFVQGRSINEHKDFLKQIANEGHTIGMHSYGHSYSKLYSDIEYFAQDTQKIESLIYDVTGIDTKFYRFPGGSSVNTNGARISDCIDYLDENNIVYVDWNVASGDAQTPSLSADTIVENVMCDVVKYKTSIVLLHDGFDKDTTVDALPTLIEKLREKGAILLPISSDTTLVQHVTNQ